jgi:RimJ/RimL family protein N-acetyltransferase
MYHLFKWANDPLARKNSFCPGKISLRKHIAWFNTRLHDENCRIFIAILRKKAIGAVRFERLKTAAIVSINIDKRHRGKGYASKALNKAIYRIFCKNFCRSLVAFIKKENSASLELFKRCGFIERPILIRKPNCDCISLVLRGNKHLADH